MAMSRSLRFVPLALIVMFVVAVAGRLARPDNHAISSRLVGQPAPALSLPPALPGRPGIAGGGLRDGRPHLVNFFASWCVPCIAEVPLLGQLKRDGVAITGIAVRDRPADLAAFLAVRGDPYGAIGADLDSQAQLSFGSSGVPETFIVDSRGIVRFQHIGPIEPGDLADVRRAWAAAQ